MPDDGRHPRVLLFSGETSVTWLLGIAVAVLVIWTLHAAGSIAVVILGGVLAALLVAPLDQAVHRALPDKLGWLGHVIAMLAICLGVAILLGALAFCATRLSTQFAALAQEGLPALTALQDGGDLRDGATGADAANLLSQFNIELSTLVTRATEQASSFVTGFLSNAIVILGGLVLVVFLALMMLVDGPHWATRLRLSTRRHEAITGGLEVLGRRIRRFALVRLGLGVVTAALYGGWIWFMGVDLVWTWMILTVVLTFVPNLGSIISGTLPTVYALFTRDLGTALILGTGLFVIEQVIGNYVDPLIAGREVSVSPLVVLISLLLWAVILGPAGTLLATPLTIAAMIFCARIEPLRPLGLMLSDCEDWDGFDRATSTGRGT